jgi:hypothetical protein
MCYVQAELNYFGPEEDPIATILVSRLGLSVAYSGGGKTGRGGGRGQWWLGFSAAQNNSHETSQD